MNDNKIIDILERIELSAWEANALAGSIIVTVDAKEITMQRNGDDVIVTVVVLGADNEGVDRCIFEPSGKESIRLYDKVNDFISAMAELQIKQKQAKEKKLKEEILIQLEKVVL